MIATGILEVRAGERHLGEEVDIFLRNWELADQLSVCMFVHNYLRYYCQRRQIVQIKLVYSTLQKKKISNIDLGYKMVIKYML